MPMLSPQLASRGGPGQGPWEMFSRRDSENTIHSSSSVTEEDVLPPLNKSRQGSLGGLTTTSFRPFDSNRAAASLFIQNIPRDMTQRELHLMFTFANDYVSSELVREPGRTCAVVKFRSNGGATAAQAVLEHRADLFGEQTSWLKCEIRPVTSGVSTGVSTPAATQPPNIKSRFLFMNEEVTTPTSDLPSSSASASASNSSSAFLPSSPLYSSSASRLFDPIPLPRRPSNGPPYEDKRPGPPPRRASVPTRPIAELSLQTGASVLNNNGSANSSGAAATPTAGTPPSAATPPTMASSIGSSLASTGSGISINTPTSASAPTSATAGLSDGFDASKVVVSFGPGTSKAKAVSIMQSGGRVMPPANPADQNPPCNTLYVGNLPPDTQEDELKDLFSVRPGYKRLCFRTKANGPMCFVEFEDEVFAGKALDDLYGFGLSNSVKGGIRLSFSKNPLGVRSRQPQQQKYFN